MIMHTDPALDTFLEFTAKDKIVHISEAVKNDGEYSEPYSIGYPIFDSVMKGGVRGGDLIVSTGRSGHGKTTWLENITFNLSRFGHPSLWFSYEVLIDHVYAKFKEMGMSKEELLVYLPKHNVSGETSWIKEKVQKSYDEFGTKFVFIDHIDYLTPMDVKNSDQKRMALRQICQELKTMAINLEVVVFLVSHVRKVTMGRHVEMEDIAESSGIYQLSDFVFAVERNTQIEEVNGKKFEIFVDGAKVRMLKNRLEGVNPLMDFDLENNIIIPKMFEKKEKADFTVQTIYN